MNLENKKRKILCLALAVCISLLSSSCGKDGSNKKTDKSDTVQSSSSASDSSEKSEAETTDSTDTEDKDASSKASADTDLSSASETGSAPAENTAASSERLTALNDLLSGQFYVKVTTDYSDDQNVRDVLTATSDTKDYYIAENVTDGKKNKIYDSCMYSDSQNKKIFWSNSLINAYRQVDGSEDPADILGDSVPIIADVKNAIDSELSATNTHIPEDKGEFEVEEYTYSGSSYMSVLDFYFDKNDDLKKYTVTYIVEGEDDLVKTVNIKELKTEADKSLIGKKPPKDQTDFGALSEDERVTFCKKIFDKYKISDEDLKEHEISEEDLKTIEYADLSAIVSVYAKKNSK